MLGGYRFIVISGYFLGVVIFVMRNGFVIRGKYRGLVFKWDVMEKNIGMFFKLKSYLKFMLIIFIN